jgi:serine/threonine protein kinase
MPRSVIIDFGHANSLNSSEPSYGCFPYMPPESRSGYVGWDGVAEDKWSLGCVLFECVTGDPFYPSSLSSSHGNAVSSLAVLHMFEKRLSTKLPHELLRHFEIRVQRKVKGTNEKKESIESGANWSVAEQSLVLKPLSENHGIDDIENSMFPLSYCLKSSRKSFQRYDAAFLDSILGLLNLDPKARVFRGFLAVGEDPVYDQELIQPLVLPEAIKQIEQAADLEAKPHQEVVVFPQTDFLQRPPPELALVNVVVTGEVKMQDVSNPLAAIALEASKSPVVPLEKTLNFADLKQFAMMIDYKKEMKKAERRSLFFDSIYFMLGFVKDSEYPSTQMLGKLARLNFKADFNDLEIKTLEKLVRNEMKKRMKNPLKRQRIE